MNIVITSRLNINVEQHLLNSIINKMKSILIILIFLSLNSLSFSQQDPTQYLNEGIAANQARAYSDAIGYLTQFLKSDPQNAIGRFNRAFAYYFTGDFHNALSDATSAIQNSPSYKEAYNLRGLINTALNIFPDAISDFGSAINLDPNYGEAFMNRGLLYKVEKDYPAAVSDLNTAVTANPALIEAYFYRGEIFVSMGNYTDAIKDLSMYISNIPDKAAAYSTRGLAYYQTGNYKDAVSDLNKAINLNPSLEPDFATILNDAKNKSTEK